MKLGGGASALRSPFGWAMGQSLDGAPALQVLRVGEAHVSVGLWAPRSFSALLLEQPQTSASSCLLLESSCPVACSSTPFSIVSPLWHPQPFLPLSQLPPATPRTLPALPSATLNSHSEPLLSRSPYCLHSAPSSHPPYSLPALYTQS